MAFSLEKFESYAYGRELELGVRELLALLQDLDSNYGRISDEFKASPLQSVDRQDADQHIWTRAAAAVTCLLSDQELTFSPQWEKSIITTHRWLSALFAATPFRNADHIMRAYNQREDKSDLSMVQLAEKDLLKFCWLYSPESEVNLDLDALWGHNPVLAAGLCIVLLSPRFLGSPIAHSKREIILPWLAERLGEVEDIELLPVGVLHDLYMHCSYADRADKHDIKKPINAQPVLLAAVGEEMHCLALHALAAALAEKRIETFFLGARTPLEAISGMVKRSAPPAVFLWAQLSQNSDSKFFTDLPAIRPAPRVIVGGPGWDPEICSDVVIAQDLTHACAEIERAVGH